MSHPGGSGIICGSFTVEATESQCCACGRFAGAARDRRGAHRRPDLGAI
jgi:hypothetical protein